MAQMSARPQRDCRCVNIPTNGIHARPMEIAWPQKLKEGEMGS